MYFIVLLFRLFLASNQRFSSGFWVRAFFFQKSIVFSTLASSPKHKYQNLLETLPICQKMVPDVTRKKKIHSATFLQFSTAAVQHFTTLWLIIYFGKAFSESTFRKSGNENSKITWQKSFKFYNSFFPRKMQYSLFLISN